MRGAVQLVKCARRVDQYGAMIDPISSGKVGRDITTFLFANISAMDGQQ